MKKTTIMLLTAMLTAPATALADSWSCSSSNNVREVHIDRPADAYVPCEVIYKKLTEGVEDQVLWNAQNDDSYCEEKANAIIAKLEGWGWVCRETVAEGDVKESEL